MSLLKCYVSGGLGIGLAFAAWAAAAKPVDFVTEVKPILEMNCVSCHNAAHAAENGNYRIDTKAGAFQIHKKAQRILPGHPDDSQVYALTVLPPSDEEHMPPKQRDPLSAEESETLHDWIVQGAEWPEGATLTTVMKVDYDRDVAPILEQGEPYSEKSQQILKLWHEQGSHGSTKGKTAKRANKQLALVEDIRQKILASSPEQTEAAMQPYTNTIPGTKVTYAMVPIPSGEFVMGSPASEPHRNADEGPQHKVKIDPFWMEKCEVTWNEYELFMYPDESKPAAPTDGTTNYTSALADAVTRPSKPYVEMSFGMGKDGYPAISMTQHACNIYCQWLSARTGHFYRLPTEAEWEYACRAGTTTAYFFGDDPKELGDYAWFADNSDAKYQKVGKKKPNPWGLYDMCGNVDQWTLDQYDPDYYKKFTEVVTEPWNKATQPYPHVVRGGSWQDDADKLRSACRRGSSADWKMQDPQLPKSIWYHTDAQFVGFRIIRPLKIPTAEEMFKYWHSGVERD
ncbi:MAG TPA: SUMF1/EgtB/PvdO family nonheme iron enzyme [Candidatus Saccharimonadales bacterium]|nr:SUMF1/EgtB/PvdO family nonheme iron enzyme [Candidatus Saccharimonadales bacterium]